jgi:hypothetical protein
MDAVVEGRSVDAPRESRHSAVLWVLYAGFLAITVAVFWWAYVHYHHDRGVAASAAAWCAVTIFGIVALIDLLLQWTGHKPLHAFIEQRPPYWLRFVGPLVSLLVGFVVGHFVWT